MLCVLLTSCYDTKRDCTKFKTGEFEFEYTIDGKLTKSRFVRNDSLEISYIGTKIDSASIRWINDCEYIVQKIQPKNRLEKKAVHIKILTTTDNGYTFEFSIVGDTNKQTGNVTLIK